MAPSSASVVKFLQETVSLGAKMVHLKAKTEHGFPEILSPQNLQYKWMGKRKGLEICGEGQGKF